MKQFIIIIATSSLLFLISCENKNKDFCGYICFGDTGACEQVHSDAEFLTIEECIQNCSQNTQPPPTRVTVFLYENCPIAQYMCGPLRDAYRYFCDTLNQNIVFRGFSPNSFSTELSVSSFVIEYDIPFNVTWDYNIIEDQPGQHTQNYLPIVTPEVFVEYNGELIYRGMIDNSYQALGQWSTPTEHYLLDVLTETLNGADIEFFETDAIGCFINY